MPGMNYGTELPEQAELDAKARYDRLTKMVDGGGKLCLSEYRSKFTGRPSGYPFPGKSRYADGSAIASAQSTFL